MAIVAPWQQRYLLALNVTSITTVPDFATAGVLAEASGLPLLKATNFPFDLDPGLQFIDQRKSIGQSTRHIGANNTRSEFQAGATIPVCTFEMDATANILALLLWSVFQTGASEAVGTPFLKTYVPYTVPTVEVWATIADMLSASVAGENQAIHGAVVRSITVSGDMTSQSIKLSVEMVGGSHVVTLDLSSAILTDPNIAVLLFKNMDVEINAASVNISAFSFTITNGLASPTYHQGTPFKHALGDLNVEGEFTIPRDSNDSSSDDNAQVTDFLALTDFTLEFFWGQSPAVADQEIAFQFNGLRTSFPGRVADQELGSTVAFMNADDDTNDISITLADAIDRTIP